MCALDLGLKTVPANVIEEPSQITNILTMFNIHNVRVQWEPMPTALKLEVLVRLLKIENPRTSKNLKKLAQITGMTKRGVDRSLILLSYPKKYQDLMLTTDTEEQVKPAFFLEAHPVLDLIEKNLPEISSRYSRNEITDKLLEKHRSGVISSAREFRELADVVRAVKRGLPKRRVIPKIEALIEEPKVTVAETYQETSRAFYEIQSLEKKALDFEHHLSTIDPEDLIENKDLVHILESVMHALDRLLSKAKKLIK